jgi:hypothetical protein
MDALILSNLKEIVYALDAPDVRLRFSLAHELGHMVLHSEQIELFRPESYSEYFSVCFSIPLECRGGQFPLRIFPVFVLVGVEIHRRHFRHSIFFECV